MDNPLKYKENHKIDKDTLDELSAKFIINLPHDERSDFVRLCFQLEQAHWFYLDFSCNSTDKKLVSCTFRQFAVHLFQHISFLREHLPRIDEILNDFKQYKSSVPTYGAILMTSDRRFVLLVQSYWARNSWGFPKGKVNQDEHPVDCAIREVEEETGYDASNLIKGDDFIEGIVNYQSTRLYIVQNVPLETVFIPKTRKEIRACEWYQLDLLPSHKTDSCKSTLGISANSFFMIIPFMKRLRKWLADHPPISDSLPFGGPIRIAKRNNTNNNNNNNGQSAAAAIIPSTQANNKRRLRNKSTGDLDAVKHLNPTEPIPKSSAAAAAAPIAINRASNLLQVAVAVSSASSNTPLTAYHETQTKGRASTKTKNITFKRQLFTGVSSIPPNNINDPSATAINTTNPTAAIKTIIGRAATHLQQQHHPNYLGKVSQQFTTFVSQSPPPTIAAKFNNGTFNVSNPTSNNTKTAPKSTLPTSGQLKKRRSIESFLNTLHSDPAIQLWKNFSLNESTIISTALPAFRYRALPQFY